MSQSATYDLDDVDQEPISNEQATDTADSEADTGANRQPNIKDSPDGDSSGFGLSFGLSHRQILIIAAVALMALYLYQRSQTGGTNRGGDSQDREISNEPEEIHVPDGDQTEKDAAVMDQLHQQGVLDSSSSTTEDDG